MSKSSILISFLSILLATPCPGQAALPTEPSYFLDHCYTTQGNYTTNTTYESNLLTALSTLQQHASVAAFYHTSAGSAPNEVHAQYYCRGDVSVDLCSTCIARATVTVFQNCSNVKAAIVWYDLCTVRYRNTSMFGELTRGRIAYSWSEANVTDPVTFDVVANATFGRLINESVNGNGFSRFAVGDVALSAFESAYFLAQCSPDLNGTECDTCLWAAYDDIPRCCGMWPVRSRVFLDTCQVRYSNELFYFTSGTSSQVVSPPPPPALEPPPASPPPPVTTPASTNASTHTGSSVRVKVGFAITGLALLMILDNNI